MHEKKAWQLNVDFINFIYTHIYLCISHFEIGAINQIA